MPRQRTESVRGGHSSVDLGSSSNSTGSTDSVQERSIEWLYWLIAGWSAMLMVLPYTPAKLLLFGGFWLVFCWMLINTPRYLPLIVIFGLPAMTFAPRVGRIPIPMVNNQTIFLLGLACAVLLVRQRADKPVSPNPLKWPPIYYAVLLFFSLVVSFYTGAAQGHTWARGWYHVDFITLLASLKVTVTFPFLAPIAFRLLSTPTHLRRTVHVVAITILLVSLDNVWGMRHAILTDSVGPYNRGEGYVGEPNAFGGLLAIMIAVFVPLLLDAKLSLRERLLLFSATGFAAIALLFTLSRGSWLALIIALGYMTYVRGVKALILLAAIALTATIWLPQSVIDRAEVTIQRSDDVLPFTEEEVALDGSTDGRLESWISLVDRWADAPIIGHGFGSYPKVNGVIRKKTGAAVAPHSTIIWLTVEMGTLGIIAYVLMIWVISMGARGILRIRDKIDDDDFLVPLALGVMTATVCQIVLDSSGLRMKNPLIMANLWILAGGLARQYWERQKVVDANELKEARQERRRSRRGKVRPNR